MKNKIVRVGMIGSSWWADSMHLPALASHNAVEIVAICGRNPDNAQKMADKWGIPHVFTDYKEMIDSGKLDAVIISTPNYTHYPMTLYALQRDLHLICEKPLALSYAQAQEIERVARQHHVQHLVPFTYSWMPTVRYIKQLLDEGYIGTPYHLNMRYYADFARDGEYVWRFDKRLAGSGVIGDLGSHFLYLAEMFYGEIDSIMCQLGYLVPREATDANGMDYEVQDDSAMVMVTFKNGAQGIIHVSAVCYEDTPFKQSHHMEFHGSGGTLYSTTDWDTIQEVRGARVGEGVPHVLPIPSEIWGGARRDIVHQTYQDLFRKEPFMVRQWVDAILNDAHDLHPNLFDGARIQRIIDAAVQSHTTGQRVRIDDIN